MSSCPTRWWEKKISWFSSPESTCLVFPVPVCFGATHPACEPPGCFVYVRGATGVDEDWPRESWNHCDHVALSSLVDLLDASDREGDDQVDHGEYDDNYEFRWKWWVMSKWLDWTLQNHLVSPNCSVASTTWSSIHSSIHSTYQAFSGTSPEAHKSLAWSCVIIEAKAGSSTGSQAAKELGCERQIKEVRFK